MTVSTTEKRILDAFRHQRETMKGTPTYTVTKIVGLGRAKGTREYEAALSLVRQGLAQVAKQDSMKLGKNTHYYLTVSPSPHNVEIPRDTPPKQERRAPSKANTNHRQATKASSPSRKRAAKVSRTVPTRNHDKKTDANHPWENKLRQAIKNCGYSDNELARKCGLAQPIISRFRNQERSLSFMNAAILANFLGFSFVLKKP